MEMNLVAMWHGMNNLVRAVVIVLTLQALACIYVAIDRLFLLVVSYLPGPEVRPARWAAAGRRRPRRRRRNRAEHIAAATWPASS